MEPFSDIERDIGKFSGVAKEQWKRNIANREKCFKDWGLHVCSTVLAKMPDFTGKIWLIQHMLKREFSEEMNVVKTIQPKKSSDSEENTESSNKMN